MTDNIANIHQKGKPDTFKGMISLLSRTLYSTNDIREHLDAQNVQDSKWARTLATRVLYCTLYACALRAYLYSHSATYNEPVVQIVNSLTGWVNISKRIPYPHPTDPRSSQ